jgi:polyhydroxybutyrate depolymerase
MSSSIELIFMAAITNSRSFARVLFWMLLSNCLVQVSFAEQTRIYTQLTAKIDGRERTYLLYLPSHYQRRKAIPLVVFLHGGGGSAKQADNTYHWREKAETEGFALLYPEGVPNGGLLGIRTWNAGSCCQYALKHNIDDLAFIAALLDELTINYPQLNSQRVYVTGMSNGAMMAYRLACEIPHRIAAIASVAGTMVYSGLCDASGIPLLHIHSRLDGRVPFNGGEGVAGNYFPAAMQGVNQWRELNGCSAEADIRQFDLYSVGHYQNCRSAAPVTLIVTEDGGHSWPEAKPRRIGGDPVSQAFSATDVIWEFFSGRY